MYAIMYIFLILTTTVQLAKSTRLFSHFACYNVISPRMSTGGGDILIFDGKSTKFCDCRRVNSITQVKQEAQLMLTNLRDAFGGQSRSSNIVPFHMLGIVSYCAIVTLSLRFVFVWFSR